MDEPNVPNVTIIKESRGGGGSWLIGIVLLIALVAGIFFAMTYASGTASKNAAVANAAKSVGTAADNVGEAAKKVAN